MVDRANEKVNCEEVERAVMVHPAFTDVAVFGMPCPTRGERICLYAVAPDGVALPNVAELGAFLRGAGLAIFIWPYWIDALPLTKDALPLTKVDKLDEARLSADIAGKVHSEAAAEPVAP